VQPERMRERQHLARLREPKRPTLLAPLTSVAPLVSCGHTRKDTCATSFSQYFFHIFSRTKHVEQAFGG
jgi:hypothetical protein